MSNHEEDIIIDDEGEANAAAQQAADNTEETQLDREKKLKATIKKLEKEKQDYLAGWQRAQADLVNLRKRDQVELETAVKRAGSRMVESLLPTLDAFNSAMSNKEAWENVSQEWRMGVEYIYSQLLSTLQEEGLTEITTEGLFNPELHEAVEERESDEVAGTIIEVVQKGYLFKDKVLREAKVVIASE